MSDYYEKTVMGELITAAKKFLNESRPWWTSEVETKQLKEAVEAAENHPTLRTEPKGTCEYTRSDEAMNTFCPECGFGVDVDEDGCCVGCGATATGDAIEQLFNDLAEQLPPPPGPEGR